MRNACRSSRSVHTSNGARSTARSYSFPSILRTVEVLFGLQPLTIEDATSPPMLDAFATTSDVRPFVSLPETIGLTKNPGKAASRRFDIDGPDEAAIADQQWVAAPGAGSLHGHHAYLARLGTLPDRVAARDAAER